MNTEANEHDGLGNGRSGSVTGKYSEIKGNLHGAGALASAASQSSQPSMEGFGGIVGISTGP